MLLSRECYRDVYLQDKSEEQIRAETKKLHREIDFLKKKMEAPEYPYETHPFPSEYDMILACRKYLEEANAALARLGAVPEYDEWELSAMAAEANLNSIRHLTLIIGVNSETRYDVSLYDKYATLVRYRDNTPSVEISLDKNSLLEELREIRIGEWHSSYICNGMPDEPVRWQLLIEYSDGISPALYEGVGAFPYNFDRLKGLLGIT